MSDRKQPSADEELDSHIAKLLVKRLEQFMAKPDIVTFAGELTIDLTALFARHRQQEVRSAELRLIKAFMGAFESKAFFIVSDFSGSDPHPQLNYEMLKEFVEFAIMNLKEEEKPFINSDDTIEEEIEKVLDALQAEGEK